MKVPKTVLLTTFKRDGTPVPTPVSLAPDGERIVFRSYDRAWKTKRLRRNPEVEFAPCTLQGRVRGPVARGRARLLDGDEAQAARRALRRRHPVLHGVLVPLAHRLAGYTTMHYELCPTTTSAASPSPSPTG